MIGAEFSGTPRSVLSRPGRVPSGATPAVTIPTTWSAVPMPRPPTPWSAVADRHVLALVDAGVPLARPGDLLVLVLEQLDPVGQPARHPGDHEQHREHVDREAHRLVDEAGVE